MSQHAVIFYNYVNNIGPISTGAIPSGGAVVNNVSKYSPEVALMYRECLDVLFGVGIWETVSRQMLPTVPRTPTEAARMSKEFYLRRDGCYKCHAIGLRHRQGGCYFCGKITSKKPLTARQMAVASGDKWYTPATACRRCKTVAKKRVANGECSGCTGATTDPDGTPDSQLMRECPDMIVSREDAKLMGFKVYRTGQPCRKGHTAYRYVSTGNCIACLKRG